MYKLSNNISLDITGDGLKGYIILSDDKDELKDLNIDDLVQGIKKFIKFGLKEEIVLNVLKNKILDERVLIAEGKKPIDGKNGKIKYHFDFEKPLLPKINPDGTVDYKDLDAINVVKNGDIIAEIIPPIDGEDGIKVNGEPI